MARDPVTPLNALADRYTVGRELGRGGMATVYLAHDVKHDRDVALKVLHPELTAALGPARFLREIRITAHLQHPHILTLIDSGEVPLGDNRQPFLYYVMPYVTGETLRERLTREGQLPVTEALHILQDVLDALGYAHQRGIVHRDIKPENVMLSGRHALVMDFGIARAATDAAVGEALAGGTLTTMGLAVGTPNYMAPEQAVGQPSIDARADIYATGAIGYEMLAGAPPVTGTTPQAVLAAQVMQTPVPMAERRPDAPAPLAAAIMRALEKDPDNRWPSAEAMLGELEKLSTPTAGTPATAPAPRRSWARPILVGGALALVAAAGLAVFSRAGGQASGTLHRALVLADAGALDSAWLLARELEKRPDAAYRAAKSRLVRTYHIVTEPPGAKVWQKAYTAPESAWVLLGVTPLDSVIAPLTLAGYEFFDSNRLRIEAPGYRTLDLVGLPFSDSIIRLDPADSIPPEMIRVPAGAVMYTGGGLRGDVVSGVPSFLIDRNEVTNRAFKQFVDSGGYRRKEYWDSSFVKDGRALPWEQAIGLMTDRTGRPGPATWEGGTFPDGMGDHPVSGVTWYEAMAYARFTGKSLPTVPHWVRAASTTGSAWIAPASNFSGRGTVAVDSLAGISAFGVRHVAGNVREWTLNPSGPDRFILGGSFNDPSYVFATPMTEPPFSRIPGNGIRLVRYTAAGDPGPAASPLVREVRDYTGVKPVSDETFRAYAQLFDYDRASLNAAIIERIEGEGFTRELVRVDAAYPGDSLLLYLYSPPGRGPHPAVVYWPGSNAWDEPVPQLDAAQNVEFIVRSGRVVVLPVLLGTYQRRVPPERIGRLGSTTFRDIVVAQTKDVSRAIDYLESRSDVTTTNLAFYGVSWGGVMGGIVPAVEPRIRLSVLIVAGLEAGGTQRPEIDPVNYLPRVKVPTIMVAGRNDWAFPLEASQKPMFELLGTPPEHKEHRVFEGSHFVPRLLWMQETLRWLDKYQPLPPS